MILALLLTLPLQNPFDTERAVLTKGVTEIVARGALAGPLSVSGDHAFTFLTGKSGAAVAPLFAGSTMGKGRVIVGGHESFFSVESLKTQSNANLLENSLQWLAGKPLTQLRAGVVDTPGIADYVKAHGGRTSPITKDASLDGIDVVCMTQDAFGNAIGTSAKLAKYVENGGSLLISGPAWGWRQTHAATMTLLNDHGGNQILKKSGIQFADGNLDGPFTTAGAENPQLNFDFASGFVTANLTNHASDPSDMAVATATIERELSFGPNPANGSLTALENAVIDVTPIPTRQHPIDTSMPRERIAARILAESGISKPNPAANDFPGAVAPNAPRISRTVTVPANRPNWFGTGLYAAPGGAVKVTTTVPVTIRIGAHTDTLWDLDKWERFPDVSRQFSAPAGTTSVTSPFGGTVYIDAGDGFGSATKVSIEGAIEAPHYVLGETTKAQWQKLIAAPYAPWTDLEGQDVILTVPTSAAKTVEDPEPLMEYWDEVMGLAYDLYSAPHRPRPERYAVDRQISAGYMHSGYPIMTGDDVAGAFVDVKSLRGQGEHVATWGFYHEMGHNFQQEAWTFDGTGEVTNNLLSLYGSEKLNGVTPETYGRAHPAMDPKAQQERLKKYLSDGAKFEDWKDNPFLALTMYAQLRVGFGWEPFKKVFAQYEASHDQPKSETEKHDLWMVRFSKTIGKNLGPFFQAWGVPTSDEARKSIANLPMWMPTDWPGEN